MPRDINGNYALPTGINPVVPGTDIEVDWANPTLNDIANALSDSLSRTGSGGMLAPFKFADGTLAAPSITWTNQPQAGFYRAAANDFRYAINGADVLMMTPTGVNVVGVASANGIPLVNTADATTIAITYAVALG